MLFSGRRIKRWRDHLGLTQVQLAERVKVTSNTIGLYERGESFPTVAKAEEIAEALHVTVFHLFDDDPDRFVTVAEPEAPPYEVGDSRLELREVPYFADWDGTWPVTDTGSPPQWPVAAELLPHDECLVIRMPDESMRPFLRTGDGVVIDPRSRAPRSLAVVAFRAEGAILVRRYKSAGTTRILAGSNPCVPPIEVDARTEIVGTVVGLVARNLMGRLAFELAPSWP